MPTSFHIRPVQINEATIELFVPNDAVNIPSQHSPYWAKLWPASLGLCYFLAANKAYITDKNILELAAGLGLPSIYAALFAKQVTASDIEPQAVELIRQSAQYNQLKNLFAAVIDWHSAELLTAPDLLLLSDINYQPADFIPLEKTIHYFLKKETTVILSTPQRLLAKPFIEKLLPFCQQQEERMVEENGWQTAISIFVLKN
jgi:methyltransferase-like protein 23